MLYNDISQYFIFCFFGGENMLGLIGLAVVILGLLISILGNTAPLIRLYFGDKSVVTQIVWGGVLFIIGAAILIYNAINL